MTNSKKAKRLQFWINVVLILITLSIVLPFVLVFISSLTDENTLIRNGYSFFPEKFSFYAYSYIIRQGEKILRAYGITVFVTIVGTVANLAMSALLAYPLSIIFVGYNQKLVELTLRAFHFYSFEFLFAGIGIFCSSFFTALNDGVTSALISFLRAMVFQVVTVLIFPLLWGVDGIWISMTFADFAAAVVAVICLLTKRKKYRY